MNQPLSFWKKYGLSVMILINIILVLIWIVLIFLTWGQIEKGEEHASGLSEQKINPVDLRRFIDSSEQKRSLLASTTITSETVSDFIDKLESDAKSLGVTFKVDQANNSDGSLNLVLSARGSFVETFKFLRLIENLPQNILITKESLLSQADGGGDILDIGKKNRSTNNWRAEIGLKVLSYHK